MNKGITYVGLDAHKDSIQVAMLAPGRHEPLEWQLANETQAVRRLAKKLMREAPGEVRCCYEAGPCGYALQRRIRAVGVGCQVVAPSLIPVKPGERVKTDRRDARKLVKLLRAGLLTEVHAPTREEEALRDLCRCREDAKEDLLRCRHRLIKMLLRRGILWSAGKRSWTRRHREWLEGLHFESAADRAVFQDYLLAISQIEERIARLDSRLEGLAGEEPYREPVAWLRCFRGIDTVTATTLVAELHDFRRFHSPRELMAYLGLVPSGHSSANSRRRGSITKAGNCHVRQVLVETAWHYRHVPALSRKYLRRRRGQPPWVVRLADRAQERLHRRYVRLSARGKPHNKVIVGIARELAGFIWVALRGDAAAVA